MSGPAYFTGVISIAKNEDWIVPLHLQTNDTPPVDVDITGSTFELQVRKTQTDATALLTIHVGDGIVIDDATTGNFTLTISRDKSRLLTDGGAYVADLVRQLPDGTIERIWEGTVNVAEGVSR